MRRLIFAVVVLAGCSDFSELDRGRDGGADLTAAVQDLGSEDASSPSDLDDGATASCDDGVRNGSETDVDCGGSCGPCDVSHTCHVDGDCQTGACVDASCELVSGPPSWVHVGTAGTGTNAPVARLEAGAGIGSDGAIYLFGGRDTSNNPVSTVEKLASDGTWSTTNNMSDVRADFAYGASGGVLLAASGSGSGNNNLYNSIDRSSMQSNWTRTFNITDKRAFTSGAFDAAGRFYLFGGFDGTNVLPSGYSFLPADVSTTPITALGTARFEHAASLGSDGRIYAIGGNDATGTLSSVEAFDTVANGWDDVSPLPYAVSFTRAALAPDGRIYVPGGISAELGIVRHEVLAYRAVTVVAPDRWIRVAPLSGPRYRHAVTVGTDGRVYAIGGASLQGFVRDVEAYGPILALDTSSANAGSTIHVSGSNFAPHATVTFRLATGTSIGTGTTDAMGVLPSTAVTVPVTAPSGATRFFATDSRSRYPVSASFNVGM